MSAALYGQKLHDPREFAGEPSTEPGYGNVSESVCGFFIGVVYDAEWVRFHYPDIEWCKVCLRRRSAA